MPEARRPRPEETPHPPSAVTRLGIYALFFFVAAVALWVPIYNRRDPEWLGVPFFYWFQMAWVVVTAAATFLAYRLKV
jgi:hypothetical protein